jgi:hypothetical protein
MKYLEATNFIVLNTIVLLKLWYFWSFKNSTLTTFFFNDTQGVRTNGRDRPASRRAPLRLALDPPRAARAPRLVPRDTHLARASRCACPRLAPRAPARVVRHPRLTLRSPASRQLSSIGR